MGIPDERCGRVAAEQHGCISAAQARECGLTREAIHRRVGAGRWRRLLPRVYAITGAPSTWEQRLFAASLWAGDGAAISGFSAAALWRFPDARRGPVEISLPRGRRGQGGVVVRRVDLDDGDVTRLDGLPVTTPARTLADVVGRLGAGAFDASFHYCLHSRLADLPSLQDVATRRCGTGFPGGARFRGAVESYAPGARPAASALEARCARLLARSPLPPPIRQHEVSLGGRRRVLDFAWPRQRVALEVDGYRWHSSRAAWESDRARIRDLRRAGWTVVQATHDDVVLHFDRLLEELAGLVAP